VSLHTFDPEIAARVGLNAAVIYQNLLFWAEKNRANRKHVMDGYVWTYNSTRAFAELFPYLTASQIKTAIVRLIDDGLLVKGDYNRASYDRTNWYSPTVTASWVDDAIGQGSPMECRNIANGLAKDRQPIPDSKPDIKPDGKKGDAAAPLPVAANQVDLFAELATPAKARLPENWAPDDDMIFYAKSKGLNDEEIGLIAFDFHAYWSDLPDAKSRKSLRGWRAAWRNRVEQIAWRYIKNRGPSGTANATGYGRGSSIASVVARRKAERQI
jgi:hypothetical protein|tara:strand:- start:1498 stop:2307 length:810 start_codon:yes stop_codon:yes gene_type:complete